MSTLLSTSTMVARLQQRIPMNLDGQFCMDKLNESYMWIEQQGAFVWNVKLATITLVALGTQVLAPTDMDVGKPASIYPRLPIPGIVAATTEIPYVPMDEFSLHEIYHTPTMQGVFSVFTIYIPTGFYTILFAPQTNAPIINTDYVVFYHMINPALSTPLTIGPNYFPTPDQFDTLLIDLAEAEIKRIYRLGGWAEALQKAQASASVELDKYRSPKRDLAGVQEQTKEVQEKSLNQAQAGG